MTNTPAPSAREVAIPPDVLEAAAKAIREVKKSSLCGICDRWPTKGARHTVYCQCDAEAQAALSAALPMVMGWRPISESPKDGGLVKVRWKNGYMAYACWEKTGSTVGSDISVGWHDEAGNKVKPPAWYFHIDDSLIDPPTPSPGEDMP